MTKKIIVNKFGGGILTKELIPFIKKRLLEQKKYGYQSIAVVSAMPKVTDEILFFIEEYKINKNKEIILLEDNIVQVKKIATEHEQRANFYKGEADKQKRLKNISIGGGILGVLLSILFL